MYLECEEGRTAIDHVYALFPVGQELSTEDKVDHLVQAFRSKRPEDLRSLLTKTFGLGSKAANTRRGGSSSHRRRTRRMRGGLELLDVLVWMCIILGSLFAYYYYEQNLAAQRQAENRQLEINAGRRAIGNAIQQVGALVPGRRGEVVQRFGVVATEVLLPIAQRRIPALGRAVQQVGRVVSNNELLIELAGEIYGWLRDMFPAGTAAPPALIRNAPPSAPANNALAPAPLAPTRNAPAPAPPARNAPAPPSAPARNALAPARNALAPARNSPTPAPPALNEPRVSINRSRLPSVQNLRHRYEREFPGFGRG